MTDDSPPTHADDALAALRDGVRYPSKHDAPRSTHITDAYGGRVSYEWPAPRILARAWARYVLTADAELLRAPTGAGLMRRPHGTDATPTPVDFGELVAALRASILALQDRPDAGRPYTDLRRYVADGDPRNVSEYLREVVQAVRTVTPRWAPPKVAKVERDRPPMTSTERVRVHRERSRAAEVASSERWCAGWVEEVDPGTRVPAPELYAQAAEVIEEWAEDGDDGDRVPGPRTFYAVADRVIGPRQRTASERYYVAPMPAAADVVERVARMAWDEQRAHLEEFLTRRAARAEEERQAA